MKYLVNRETKEHRILNKSNQHMIGMLDIVEADSEGWIPWSGGERPLPDDCECEIEIADGERVDSRMAADFMWSKKIGDGSVMKYRPILTEQSAPTCQESRQVDESIFADVTVFDRLRTATEHAASIPSIIAEIDALLPDGYQVVRVEKVEATAPQEDMSDWRNWREGDLVRRVSASCPSVYTQGNLYAVHSCGDGVIRIHDDCSAGSFCFFRDDVAEKFIFHSRPTGAAK